MYAAKIIQICNFHKKYLYKINFQINNNFSKKVKKLKKLLKKNINY